MASASLDLINAWRLKGIRLEVPGTAGTFMWKEGSGPTVLCLNGVPASAFLYRKVLTALSERDLTGVVMDFPGLGFADRPEKFDYSWSGLAEWLVKAIDAAGITDFHLVVHDIGGPIGFELIRRIPDKILSLTVLNTMVKVNGFKKPWSMMGFEFRGVGELLVRTIDSPVIIAFMRAQGVMSTPSNQELRAYGQLLRLNDNGVAFLKIMRSFETNKEFEEKILNTLKERKFPAQVIWGEFDSVLNETHAKATCEALKVEKYFIVPGKHFIQEDNFSEIAGHISSLVNLGKDRSPA